MAAKGYLPRRVATVAGDTTVVLRPFPEVVVRNAGGWPILPVGRDLRVSIQGPANAEDRDYASDRGGGRLHPWLEPPRSSAELGEGSEVALQVAESGLHRLTVTLVDTVTGKPSPIRGIEPSELAIRPSSGLEILEITIPERGLQEALEEVGGG